MAECNWCIYVVRCEDKDGKVFYICEARDNMKIADAKPNCDKFLDIFNVLKRK